MTGIGSLNRFRKTYIFLCADVEGVGKKRLLIMNRREQRKFDREKQQVLEENGCTQSFQCANNPSMCDCGLLSSRGPTPLEALEHLWRKWRKKGIAEAIEL